MTQKKNVIKRIIYLNFFHMRTVADTVSGNHHFTTATPHLLVPHPLAGFTYRAVWVLAVKDSHLHLSLEACPCLLGSYFSRRCPEGYSHRLMRQGWNSPALLLLGKTVSMMLSMPQNILPHPKVKLLLKAHPCQVSPLNYLAPLTPL